MSPNPAPSVRVLGIDVSTASAEALASDIAVLSADASGPTLSYALHVGGLVEADKNTGYRDTMNGADIVYADGAAVVLLARRKGVHIERIPTTDFGHTLIERIKSMHPERSVRVALIGGEPGLAERASEELVRQHGVAIAMVTHGFHQTWGEQLAALRESTPDIVIVGLGAPREMEWCDTHRGELPTAIVLTCGGWFGFLTGAESRAPKWMQRIGLEWIWRLQQSPKRLWSRYWNGMTVVAREFISPR